MRMLERQRRWILTPLCGALLGISMSGCDPPSRYGQLPTQWSVSTGDTIAATPAFGDGKVYIGSWNGYEYALDQATGAQSWRTYLGQQTNPSCDTVGVTSSPALVGNAMYLGGGAAHWYALNRANGAVLWTLPTGDPGTGHYNWATPAVHNGHAYIGISSLCDAPLVHGKLLRVNLATHQVVNTWHVVPGTQLGGTIWTTPVVDPARNTVFVTTGNRAYDSTGDSQVHAEALVALDATTLAIKGYWSLPVSDPTPDADWGTAPTLFRDALGRDLVSAGNKNGVLYAFLRDNVSAGPVWSRAVAQPAAGSDPAAGGLYSNGLWDGQGKLFYAGGRTVVGGKTVEGSVRALNPTTGAVIWETGLGSKVLGALTGGNGLIVVPALKALYVLNANTGEVLYAHEMTLYAAGRIFGGRLFLGDFGGVMRAFTFPASPAGPAVAAAATASLSCTSATDRCEVQVARGCQQLKRIPSALGTSQLRVKRVGTKRHRRGTLALHAGSNCSGRALLRAPLGREQLILPLPKAYRTLAKGARLSVSSSKAMRLRVLFERR